MDEYNGNLEFWDAKPEKKVKSISPIFNRCVIFRTDKKSFHGHPEKLNLPPNLSRKSIATLTESLIAIYKRVKVWLISLELSQSQ